MSLEWFFLRLDADQLQLWVEVGVTQWLAGIFCPPMDFYGQFWPVTILSI